MLIEASPVLDLELRRCDHSFSTMLGLFHLSESILPMVRLKSVTNVFFYSSNTRFWSRKKVLRKEVVVAPRRRVRVRVEAKQRYIL